MPKFVIVATIEIAPGRITDFMPLLLAHRKRCLNDEPGTVQFDVLQPHGEPDKLMFYEVYEDEAAFEQHWVGPSTTRLREEVAGMVKNLSGTRCSLMEQA